MSKKSTRSTKLKADPDAVTQQQVACATKKVFYISEKLLDAKDAKDDQRLCLEHFYHPGKARPALFVTLREHAIMEVLEYAEPRRSWLMNSEVCSNGRTYMTTPIDATLLALHHLRRHCSQRAMSLDNISVDEPDASTHRLLTKFVRADGLKCVADVKKSGDLIFYKYNSDRALAWLALKTRQVVLVLKAKQVHCGLGAKSENYVRSEKLVEENDVNEMDYMRMACDYVGRYLDADLHAELTRYLHIPSEIQALVEEKANTQKRKSQQDAAGANSKKIKLGNGKEDAASQLRKSSLLDNDDIKEESNKSPSTPVPLKERSMSAKEKALAKGAKGSKSISSFFKVK
ncbi:ribonuclease H2 subunit B [Drosophila grimshawi]|uniref:Ribonuclease H2 subunit B n=1 Tax=Drosophila grimshawi TaxID=7222 RepID=B4J9I8_DROGR|nr:ribonuclease H2 subunit B [Drosophila grimshawi]EDW02495.1 GH22020 [Drosophila grimshawi]